MQWFVYDLHICSTYPLFKNAVLRLSPETLTKTPSHPITNRPGAHQQQPKAQCRPTALVALSQAGMEILEMPGGLKTGKSGGKKVGICIVTICFQYLAKNHLLSVILIIDHELYIIWFWAQQIGKCGMKDHLTHQKVVLMTVYGGIVTGAPVQGECSIANQQVMGMFFRNQVWGDLWSSAISVMSTTTQAFSRAARQRSLSGSHSQLVSRSVWKPSRSRSESPAENSPVADHFAHPTLNAVLAGDLCYFPRCSWLWSKFWGYTLRYSARLHHVHWRFFPFFSPFVG